MPSTDPRDLTNEGDERKLRADRAGREGSLQGHAGLCLRWPFHCLRVHLPTSRLLSN